MKICCDTSLEPSQWEGSNGGSQNMFLWTNMANYPLSIPVTHYLELYIYNLNPMPFDIIILFQVNSMDRELQLWIF